MMNLLYGAEGSIPTKVIREELRRPSIFKDVRACQRMKSMTKLRRFSSRKVSVDSFKQSATSERDMEEIKLMD